MFEGLSNCTAEKDRKRSDKPSDKCNMVHDMKMETMERNECRTSGVNEKKEEDASSCRGEVNEADCRWQGK